MSSRFAARTPLTLACLLLSGLSPACAQDENYLEGSLAETYDLAFESTQARRYDSELALEFVRGEAEYAVVVLRVTVETAAGLESGGVYDLAASGAVTRASAAGPALPELTGGLLELTELGEAAGDPVMARFDATFESLDGSRLALHGGFSAPLEVVGW